MDKNKTEQQKLSDKAFFRMIFTAVLGVVVCVICLCSTSWAWFTGGIASDKNEIKTGQCLLTISVGDGTQELANIEDGVELTSEKTYTVTLTLPKGSASGYCLMEPTGAEKAQYYSAGLLRNDGETDKVLSFTLKVEGTLTVKFLVGWGIYSGDVDVERDETLEIKLKK